MEINTENGLYIESPALAKELAAMFDAMMQSGNAWRVHLNEEEEKAPPGLTMLPFCDNVF